MGRGAADLAPQGREAHDRTGGRADGLITSDEYPAYATAIELVYGEPGPPCQPETPGRRPTVPTLRLPADLTYATVHKEREAGRVVAITTAVVFGTAATLAAALGRSSVSRSINTSFVERHHATGRQGNARKSRRTYRFSKDWRMHEAQTYLTPYAGNFCRPIRTLRERSPDGSWRRRTLRWPPAWPIT